MASRLPAGPMKTLRVKSELKELDRIRRFLRRGLHGLELGEEDVYKIELSLVEMCTNIMRYAYPESRGDIHIRSWHEDARLYLELRDDGVAFDPRTVKKPSMREMLSGERMGGLGIFLARRLMDGFDYRREDGQNVLTMFKKAGAGKA
jgi:anti-sigma regulatory factor (Ser/Thr protein kinase)